MKNIESFQLSFDEVPAADTDKRVTEIFNLRRRRLIEVSLKNNAVLKKHKAMEPITVLCLSGRGTFRAGPNLEDEHRLEAGALLTLEADVEHEIVARPDLHLLVTKFKSD